MKIGLDVSKMHELSENRGIGAYSQNLYEAIKALGEDEVVKEALGSHIYNKFVELKKLEWDDFRTTVTEWEIKRYIKMM